MKSTHSGNRRTLSYKDAATLILKLTITPSMAIFHRATNRNVICLLLVVLAMVGLTFCCDFARADLVLDQVADAFGTSDPNLGLGGPSIDEAQTAFQTFTVGIGGILAAVDVQVQHGPEGVPNSDLELTMRRALVNGEPDRTQDLGSVSLTPSQIPVFDNFASGPYTTFDVRGLNITVLPGEVLAFELSSSTTFNRSYFIYDSQTDIYAGGKEFIFGPLDGAFFSNPIRDLGFRTFVAVPEPSMVAFLGLAGLLVASSRFKRRRTSVSSDFNFF